MKMQLLEHEQDPTKKHYTYIGNFSRLLRDMSKHCGTTYVCNNCPHPFTNKQAHDNHLRNCQYHPAQHLKYPTDDPILKFKSTRKKYKLPFWRVADIEAFISPIDGVDAENDDDDDDDVCGMRPVDEHIMSGFVVTASRRMPHTKQRTSYIASSMVLGVWRHLVSYVPQIRLRGVFARSPRGLRGLCERLTSPSSPLSHWEPPCRLSHPPVPVHQFPTAHHSTPCACTNARFGATQVNGLAIPQLWNDVTNTPCGDGPPQQRLSRVQP